MQENQAEVNFLDFTPEILLHFESFLSKEDYLSLLKTSKRIEACFIGSLSQSERELQFEIEKNRPRYQKLEDKRWELYELKSLSADHENSFLGHVVTVICSRVCQILKITALFFFLFPILQLKAHHYYYLYPGEISKKEFEIAQEIPFEKRFHHLQAQLRQVQIFKEFESKEIWLKRLFGNNQEFSSIPCLKWTNPETMEIDLDKINPSVVTSAIMKGVDSWGRKFLIIRYRTEKTKEYGLQIIRQSYKDSLSWITSHRGHALLPTNDLFVTRDFIRELKIIIENRGTKSDIIR